MFEGSNRHFDQTLCMGLSITDEDIDSLCQSMKEQAVKNANNEVQKESVKEVGRQQLRSWGILIERDGKDYPTNAYAILTGAGAFHTATQCGVFKGSTKEVFVDRREYDGPIWEQIEQAFQYVLRNIHLGANIVGIYRQDVYEIPPDAIRELIINAAVHRSYLDHGNIQIAIYDDRLEITSPGRLPLGQTIERMKQGYSKIRNEALASAFEYMGYIEHWGSGILRVLQEVRDAGLPEPEFLGGDTDLRINIYRNGSETGSDDGIVTGLRRDSLSDDGIAEETTSKTNAAPNATITVLPSQKERILDALRKNASISISDAIRILGVQERQAQRILKSLIEEGSAVKIGAARATRYAEAKKRTELHE